MKKTLLPTSFSDYLTWFSVAGFLGIFLYFTFGISWLNENSTGIFLVLGGFAFLILSKVFSLGKLFKNGIQPNEFTLVLGLVFGFTSVIIGILLLLGINIPERFFGYIGILALVPIVYMIIDYVKRNN